MTSLTLIPNDYAITSLITLILGSFFIANHVYDRWLRQFNFKLIDVNLLTKFSITLFGSTIVSWKPLFSASLEIQLAGALIGILMGYICLTIESNLIAMLQKTPPHSAPARAKEPSSYFSIIAVGSLEEILYRGFLTVLCLNQLSPGASGLALIGFTFIFALSHLNLGNIHVLTKLILGTVCLISFLITKTLITPIFIHASFNAFVINRYRKLAYD